MFLVPRHYFILATFLNLHVYCSYQPRLVCDEGKPARHDWYLTDQRIYTVSSIAPQGASIYLILWECD